MGAYIGEMGVVSCLFSGLEYISGSGIRREGRRRGGGLPMAKPGVRKSEGGNNEIGAL